ncbi:MAG: ABC transporter substrate-binding protein [Deltaproteobacteria bacterium]|jgi:iron complex transport system substrate-binding protein|nr:ABC transporter substrate-binding protein [Deltaproteobacteria bacterium]
MSRAIFIILVITCLLGFFLSEDTEATEAWAADNPKTLVYPMAFENHGRTLTVKSKPAKVVTYGVPASELMAALGLDHLLAARVHEDHSRGVLPEYEEALSRVPKISDSFARENKDIADGMDFVIGKFRPASRELRWTYPPVYVLETADFEENRRQIREVGRIFQVEDKAEGIAAGLDRGLAAVAARLTVLYPIKVLILDMRPDGFFAAGSKDFESQLVEAANGGNVFNDMEYWSKVTAPEISARQPEILLLLDYGPTAADNKIAALKEDPTLSKLRAVETGRILVLPLDTLQPGVRVALAVETLARYFHPSLFGH